MRSVFLLSFVAQANAKTVGADRRGDTQDSIMSTVVNKLFDRMLEISPLEHAELEKTTFAKTYADSDFGRLPMRWEEDRRDRRPDSRERGYYPPPGGGRSDRPGLGGDMRQRGEYFREPSRSNFRSDSRDSFRGTYRNQFNSRSNFRGGGGFRRNFRGNYRNDFDDYRDNGPFREKSERELDAELDEYLAGKWQLKAGRKVDPRSLGPDPGPTEDLKTQEKMKEEGAETKMEEESPNLIVHNKTEQA